MKSIPGDPFTEEQAIPEEIMKNLYSHYGLDKPLHIQYMKYIKGFLTLDLGPSFKYEGRTTNQIIKEGFPISATLGCVAFFLAVFWGVFWGSIAAFYKGRFLDHFAMILAVGGMSVPSFLTATFLQYIFSIKLGILPIARWGTISHMILPAIALAAFPSAFIARMTRASMVEVLQKEYILTARAKGLSKFKIWQKHVLKNSFLPVISYLGTLFASITTGSFIVEKIFGIPGLGGWMVSSITNRDYTIIMGLTIFYSFILLTSIVITDIVYFFLDPRIKDRFQNYELS
ncbi:MAG: Oligopeptide transport system permease protein OppB [Chlamydiia bacterium]|nr:Oligopeptide transport system permease protein OppB [Chlamydiia bacterium]